MPAAIRNRDRVIGVGEPVLTQYERIAFEKDLLAIQGKPLAAFVCPGHPLLDSTLDLILERHRDLLKRGAVLVDPQGQCDDVRVLFYLEQKFKMAGCIQTAHGGSSPSKCSFLKLMRTTGFVNPDMLLTSTTAR